MHRQSLREAFLLISIAALLGFSYTFITRQGFFTETKQHPLTQTSNLEMIPLVKAKELHSAKTALFIDARHEFDFKAGHIQSAISVPLKEIDSHQSWVKETPKDKLLVVYCDGIECNSSIELAVKLTESGFTNVKIFFGGWQEWKSAHFPVE